MCGLIAIQQTHPRLALDEMDQALALLWQIYLRCLSAPIWVRQYGHR